MKRYSLYTIVFVVIAIVFVISLASIYFSISQHRKDLLESAVKEKTSLAATINETILSPIWQYQITVSPGGAIGKTFIAGLMNLSDIRYVRIVKLSGDIYISSIGEESGQVIKDPDIEKAITTKKIIVRDEIFGEEKIKTIIYPGYEDRTVWIGFSLKSVEQAIGAILIRDITVALGGLIFMALIIFLILRMIIATLKKMTLACEEIKKGNLDITVNVESKTEIGELAMTFNEMIRDLKESRKALEEAKAVLEIKVEARTKELRELAEGLEEEVKKRTQEIQEKMVELERFQKLAVGRELKMMELKKEIGRLKKELEKPKGRQS